MRMKHVLALCCSIIACCSALSAQQSAGVQPPLGYSILQLSEYLGTDRTAEVKVILEKKDSQLSDERILQMMMFRAAQKSPKEEWDLLVKYVKDDSFYNKPDMTGPNKWTLLHWAVKNEKCALELVKFLVGEKKVDIESMTNEGFTAIFLAHDKVLYYLLEQGANINANKQGRTALMAHCMGGNERAKYTLELLERGADPDIRDKMGKNALIIAAEHGQSQSIPALLDAMLKRVEDHQYTSTKYVVDRRDNFGYTALMRAAIADHVECVRVLTAAGADPNLPVPGHLGCTVLFDINVKGETVKALIAGGADANARNHAMGTPLTWRCWAPHNDHLGALEALLQNGADPSLLDGNGYTAYDAAVKRGFGKAIELLKKHNGVFYGPRTGGGRN